MNRTVFFDLVRASIYGGRLSTKQVDGLNALLDSWYAEPGRPDVRHLAYCLATAHHETAMTMQPIAEYGSNARANRLYGIEGANPNRARKMGNTNTGDGARYKGRGYVQLTWKNNYKRAGPVVGADLVRNPDLAMRPDYAAQILFQGCIEGWFTTRRLDHYITARGTDYHNARRVVNGTDKAATIAEYAVKFEAALRSALVDSPAPPAEAPPQAPTPARQRNIFAIVIDAILSTFKRR